MLEGDTRGTLREEGVVIQGWGCIGHKDTAKVQ